MCTRPSSALRGSFITADVGICFLPQLRHAGAFCEEIEDYRVLRPLVGNFGVVVDNYRNQSTYRCHPKTLPDLCGISTAAWWVVTRLTSEVRPVISKLWPCQISRDPGLKTLRHIRAMTFWQVTMLLRSQSKGHLASRPSAGRCSLVSLSERTRINYSRSSRLYRATSNRRPSFCSVKVDSD